MKKVYSGIQTAIYNKTYDLEEAIALKFGKIYISDEYVLINKPIELNRNITFENCVVILGEKGRILMKYLIYNLRKPRIAFKIFIAM